MNEKLAPQFIKLGYWATELCYFTDLIPLPYDKVFKGQLEIRKNKYLNLKNEFDKIYSNILKKIEELIGGIKYNVLIVRGFPKKDGIYKKFSLSETRESVAWNYHESTVIKKGFQSNMSIENIIAYLEQNLIAKDIPLFICGDSHEDIYANILNEFGYKCITKNREFLLKNKLSITDLAKIDFIICLKGEKLIGPTASSLRFAAKECRHYLGVDTNFINKKDWLCITSVLPIYMINGHFIKDAKTSFSDIFSYSI